MPPSRRRPKPAGGSVREDPPVIGHELVARIFRGDAALDGVAVAGHGVLTGRPSSREVRLCPWAMRIWDWTRSMPVICFGDGVLDLDPGVHLDEEPLVAVEVVEEFDRAGVVVTDLLRHACGGVAELPDHGRAGRTLGAISMTFWWRRCTEQSRSCRCMTLPWRSPRIWTSRCFACGMYFSRNTAGIAEGPAGLGLRFVEQLGRGRRPSRTTRIPRPPPPNAALMISGNPMALAALQRFVALGERFLGPGERGNADAFGHGARRGLVAHRSRSSGRGPTKVMPARPQARANSAFSLRKP
jgi:hypothetical protein